MDYKHRVQKWNGHYFKEEISSSTSYYSMAAYLDGGDDTDDTEVETLADLYKLWKEAKAGDAACCEKGWKYRFYKHDIEENKEKSVRGGGSFIDCVTEGKMYRRGNKVFFKPIGQ